MKRIVLLGLLSTAFATQGTGIELQLLSWLMPDDCRPDYECLADPNFVESDRADRGSCMANEILENYEDHVCNGDSSNHVSDVSFENFFLDSERLTFYHAHLYCMYGLCGWHMTQFDQANLLGDIPAQAAYLFRGENADGSLPWRLDLVRKAALVLGATATLARVRLPIPIDSNTLLVTHAVALACSGLRESMLGCDDEGQEEPE